MREAHARLNARGSPQIRLALRDRRIQSATIELGDVSEQIFDRDRRCACGDTIVQRADPYHGLPARASDAENG
jgi:hypothetical protein